MVINKCSKIIHEGGALFNILFGHCRTNIVITIYKRERERERERERVEAKIRKAGTLITYHLELAFGRMAQETWRPI